MLRKSVLISFALTVAFSALGSADDAKIAKGKGVYELRECKMCHSIAGEGNKKTPLDGVGSKFDAATLRKWVISPKEMKPEVKKPDFSKTITGEDLDALVAYLASLKK